MNKKIYPSSEGEEFLYDYFKQEKYKVEYQKEIIGLRGDEKKYRIADFFLPEINIYVEFFGLWNHGDDAKEAYRRKKKVYYENNLPCIYIYPENLGILPYIFNRRVLRELKLHGTRFDRIIFRWHLFTNNASKHLNWFVVSIGISIISFVYGLEWRYLLTAALGAIGIYHGIRTFKAIKYYFLELR